MTGVELIATAAMAIATGVAARRHPPIALAIVLLGLLLASASVGEVKEVFLAARWGALVVLPLALFWPLPRRLEELSFELGAVAVTAVLALSAVWSIDPKLTLMRAASFGLLLLGVARLVRSKAWDPRGVVDVIAALSVTVGLASVVLWSVRPDIAVYVGELRGVLENQNGLGLFLGLTYPFVLAAADRRMGKRVWFVGPTVLCAALIGLTESRTGLLALVTGLVVYEVATRSARRLVLQVLVGLSLFLAVNLSISSLDGGQLAAPSAAPPHRAGPGAEPVPSGPPRPPERPDILGRGATPGQGRLAALLGARNEAWSATGALILDRPLLGYGFGTGDRVFARYPDRAEFLYFQGANPNNGYLQAGLELGVLLGFVILAPPLFAALTGAVRTRKQRFTAERAAFLACLVGGLVAAVFESLLTAAGAPWALLIWLSAVALLPEWAPRRARASDSAAARNPTLVESWVGERGSESASAPAENRSIAHEQPSPRSDPSLTSVPPLPP